MRLGLPGMGMMPAGCRGIRMVANITDASTERPKIVLAAYSADTIITVDWGDGTRTVQSVGTSNVIFPDATGKDYSESGNGTYHVRVYGNLTEQKTLILTPEMGVPMSEVVNMTGLAYLELQKTQSSGEVESLAGLTGLYYVNAKETIVSGDVGPLVRIARLIELQDTAVDSYTNPGGVISESLGTHAYKFHNTGMGIDEFAQLCIDIERSSVNNGYLSMYGCVVHAYTSEGTPSLETHSAEALAAYETLVGAGRGWTIEHDGNVS